MADDHLSNETSVSFELTQAGLAASARSRAIAAIDRFVGSAIDVPTAWLEGISVRSRVKTEGERQLIEATAQREIDPLRSDEEFAERAYTNFFKKIVARQINREAVAAAAIDHLKHDMPDEDDPSAGNVSEEFISRFETYAEQATTNELRDRWGRVLASEIRKPGTFNRKVLRATDELESSTALLFESLMRYRCRDFLVKCIIPEVPFRDLRMLVSAGLLVDPSSHGHKMIFGISRSFLGDDICALRFGEITLSFSRSASFTSRNESVLRPHAQNPSFDVYLITDVGLALSSILPADETGVGLEYAKKLASIMNPATLVLAKEVSPGKSVNIPIPT